MQVQLVIQGETTTGVVAVTGPVQDMHIVHWLLGEARRIAERHANKREDAAENGKPDLILARELPPST